MPDRDDDVPNNEIHDDESDAEEAIKDIQNVREEDKPDID